MATNLPTNIDATYEDRNEGDRTHQQHHDAIHGYTNAHDGAVDPHGDRAYADQQKVAKSGDTMTGDLTVEADLIARGPTNPGTVGELERIRFQGYDGVGNLHSFIQLIAVADDVTDLSEDSRLVFRLIANGAEVDPLQLAGHQTRVADGTAASPALTFQSSSDTGIYRSGPGVLDFATGGVRRVAIGSTGLLYITDGTATRPGLTFLNDQDTGIYRHSVDVVGIATAGVARYAMGLNFIPLVDNSSNLGDATKRWKDIYATNGTIQTSDVNDKTDVIPIAGSAALDRVLRTAANAIRFRWANGTRIHAGFSAQGVGQEHGDDTAAYIDPAVEANARTNPYAATDPTAEWYADYVDEDADADEQTEQRTEAEAEWVKARDDFDAETQAMLEAPKGLRPSELIPDLYAALAEQQKQIEALTARVAALEAA